MSNSGELHTFPVSAGLLDPRHVQAIDPSSPLWIYLWLLNRVTRDEERGDDFLGIVLHGRSVSIRQIADELGIKERACRRHLARLVRAGYVLKRRLASGRAATRSRNRSDGRGRDGRPRTGIRSRMDPIYRPVFGLRLPNPQTKKWPRGLTKKWPQGRDPQTRFWSSLTKKWPLQ